MMNFQLHDYNDISSRVQLALDAHLKSAPLCEGLGNELFELKGALNSNLQERFERLVLAALNFLKLEGLAQEISIQSTIADKTTLCYRINIHLNHDTLNIGGTHEL